MPSCDKVKSTLGGRKRPAPSTGDILSDDVSEGNLDSTSYVIVPTAGVANEDS